MTNCRCFPKVYLQWVWNLAISIRTALCCSSIRRWHPFPKIMITRAEDTKELYWPNNMRWWATKDVRCRELTPLFHLSPQYMSWLRYHIPFPLNPVMLVQLARSPSMTEIYQTHTHMSRKLFSRKLPIGPGLFMRNCESSFAVQCIRY
jgi:hypothetical protein